MVNSNQLWAIFICILAKANNGINIPLGYEVGNNIAPPDHGNNIQPPQGNEAAMNQPILW